MKKKLLKILIFLIIIAFPIAALKAAGTNASQAVFISKSDVVSGNLFAVGDTITVDGVITGDLIAAARSITVNGRVEGDIIVAAQNINIAGDVGGNVRVVGNSIIINNVIARNLNAFGSDVVVGDGARIGWDALIGASSSQVKGVINGSLNVYGRDSIISGKVGKNVIIKIYNESQSQNIIIAKEAIINGDLNYTAQNKANITEGADIAGQINYQIPVVKEKNNATTWAWGRLFSILSIMVIGLIFVFILPQQTKKIVLNIKQRPGKIILIGAITLLTIPPLAILLALSIIGIPLAIALGGLLLAGMIIAKAVAAILLGELLIKDLAKKIQAHLFWSLLLGTIILSLLYSLPIVGWIISLLAIWLGLGSILHYATNKSENI